MDKDMGQEKSFSSKNQLACAPPYRWLLSTNYFRIGEKTYDLVPLQKKIWKVMYDCERIGAGIMKRYTYEFVSSSYTIRLVSPAFNQARFTRTGG